MNESYIVEKLIIGKIYISTNLGSSHGPMDITNPITYIFYKQNEDEAKEIFTDDIFKISLTGEYEFNKAYIKDIENINDYLTEDEIRLGTVMKWRLVKIYNQINFQKDNAKKYTKK